MTLLSIEKKIARLLGAVAAMAAMMICTVNANAYEARVHCAEDTIKVSELLKKTAEHGGTLGERCVFVAKELSGTPWAPAPDNDEKGTIMIDFHGFDRLGFVNSVLALAHASMQKLPRVKEYERFYEQLSRRKGQDDGFASQLYYGAEWIVDNVYRGNLKEMTEYVTGGGFKTKTFDYMTRHKDEFPALADPAVYDQVRMNEMGYRSHRIPHLKKQSVGNKPLHELMLDGDIILMLSPEPDTDIYDIGIIEMQNGEPYMIHINHDHGVVDVDSYPLSRLFKLEGQHFYGYRWLRPTE